MANAAQVAEVQAESPSNVYVLQRHSAWSNADVLVEVIVMLTYIFQPLRDHVHVVLTMDSCSCHLTRKIFAAARFHGMGLSCIAAHLTYLLQPLDTSVFAVEKLLLRRAFTTLSLASGTTQVPLLPWLKAVQATVGELFSTRDFSSSFARNGFSEDLGAITPKILQAMNLPALPEISDAPPSAAQLKEILPTERQVHPDIIYRPLRSGLTRAEIAAGDAFHAHFIMSVAAIVREPQASHTWNAPSRLLRKTSLAQAEDSQPEPPAAAAASSAAGPALAPPPPPGP